MLWRTVWPASLRGCAVLVLAAMLLHAAHLHRLAEGLVASPPAHHVHVGGPWDGGEPGPSLARALDTACSAVEAVLGRLDPVGIAAMAVAALALVGWRQVASWVVVQAPLHPPPAWRRRALLGAYLL